MSTRKITGEKGRPFLSGDFIFPTGSKSTSLYCGSIFDTQEIGNLSDVSLILVIMVSANLKLKIYFHSIGYAVTCTLLANSHLRQKEKPHRKLSNGFPVRFLLGAGNVTRTHDLLITNRIRCKNLGKTGLFSPFLAVESSGQHSFPERHHTHIFRCGSERGSAEEKDRISCTSYFELHKQRNKLRQDMPSFKSMKMCISVITY